MIKEFKNITDKDLAYMQTHKVTVTEKLDMIYFKVIITESGVYPLTSKNKQIGKVIDSQKAFTKLWNTYLKKAKEHSDKVIIKIT